MFDRSEHCLDIREKQDAALHILKVIDDICKKNNLRYWIMYGSLIGAVRHEGFIPWDDDLDIAMPRPDYERLLAYFKSHQDELDPLVAIIPDRERCLPFLITRISDTTYKMIGEFGDYIDELGAFVDVYPFDGCGSTLEEAQKHIKLTHRISLQYWLANNHPKHHKNDGVLKRVVKIIVAGLYGKAGHYIDRLEQEYHKYSFDDSEYVHQLAWSALPGQPVFRREWFDETLWVPFEDMSVPIPKEYASVLGIDYEDYRALPPEEERVGHHGYDLVKRNVSISSQYG